MAEIPVEKKSSSSWLWWLIGLLVLAAIVWFIYQAFDDERAEADIAPASTAPAVVTPGPGTAATGTTTPLADTTPATPAAGTAAGTGTAATAAAAPGTAAGEPITDTGAYAASGDKLALVGRRVELTNARVARIVGPKTFTVESGTEEMFVMVDEDLSKGVGTQGKIDKGNVLNVKGSFRRLAAEEISDVSNARFRDLTEEGRETLRKTQVYLHATEFSKIS